ncbi:hypothetical protein Sango_2465200 [Sesamum angolense]|uniref:Oberon PHD finger domain-containing protein n=1 Tax=Sesamum angolense TaxID=2727404 RepID=A0AAE1W8B3_9LAMI|nr:hypothetical protein Sango_2465200 [Sesamum angolense]
MTSELQKESMDIDSPGGSKGSADKLQENGLNLYPVSANGSGEGLPYAPEDWPNPGDKWGWKVGRRTSISGFYLDRYVYLPSRLHETGHKKKFASKLSVKQYIRAKFPHTDIDAFFASFSWRIPSKSSKIGDGEMFRHPGETADDPASDIHINGVRSCDGYGYIRCEANIEGYACGHSCHIDCALRAYMAGTVGGSIGLDAEYYCRRCDSRTNLVSHVIKLLENCESIVSPDDIEKILKIGICVLRGSKKASAKQLLHHIESAMSKLKNGTNLEDIWKNEDASAAIAVRLSLNSNGALGFAENEPQDQETGSPPSSILDHLVESLKLEDEVDQILDSLRKSQEIEYRLAEERLSTQKNYILNLYQQINKERSSEDQDSLLDEVLSRVDQVKREVSRLKDMADVSKGFGRVPKHILKELFGLDIEL